MIQRDNNPINQKLKTLAAAVALSVGAFGVSDVLAAPGDLLWSYKTDGQIWGDIQVRGKTAYFGSDDGYMHAVNTKTQELQWKFHTGDKVRSKPAFKRHWMFFTSDDGFLYAVNRKSGELFWKLDIGDADVVRDINVDFVWSESSPVIKGNTLYVGSGDGNLYAVSIYSGEIKWTTQLSGAVVSDPSVSGNLVYAGTMAGDVYGINRRTGEPIWTFEATKGDYWWSHIISSPVVIDGQVITSSRDARIYTMDAQTGEPGWSLVEPSWTWFDSTAIAGDDEGTLFIGSSDEKALYKMDSETGETLWKAPTTGWAWGTPTLEDDTVYIGSTGTDVYGDLKPGFQAVDAETGELEWSYQPAIIDDLGQYVNGGVNARVAVKHGQVFVGDLDGHLYVFEE